tara:strand:- start:49 stop:249 length:201 start_codon:yes stop_codon:yes gene_type:complete
VDKNSPNYWMRYSGVGIQITAIMIISWWIGMKIEEKTFIIEPLGQIVGLFFGIFAGIYNLLKSVQN